MMKKFLSHVSFTKSETRVIIFLISVLTAGFIIKYYNEIFLSDSVKQFDFSKSDSVFTKRSATAIENEKFEIEKQNDDSLIKLFEQSNDSVALRLNESFNSEIPENIININTASKDELIDLPGIGESTADKIILYREQNGAFKRADELLKVKGIGKKKFEKLKNYIKAE